jgi:hypothetical protein
MLALAAAALAADFGGRWQIEATIGGNPAKIECTLVQRGDTLSGTCKPEQFDPSDVTGSIAGTNAKWSYDVVFNGNPSHVEYEAVLGGDGKLTGTLHLGATPVPFTATREEP